MTETEKALREAAQLALDTLLLPIPNIQTTEPEYWEFETQQELAIEALRKALKQ